VIQSILGWLGFVWLHEPGQTERLMLVTDELRRVTRAEVPDAAPGGSEPRIVVADDLTIHLTYPEPIHVWSVLAFADPLSYGEESVFAITADSIRAAQAAGFLPSHVEQFFGRQKGAKIPGDFGERVQALLERAEGFELSSALIIDAPTDEKAQAVRSLLENDGYVVSQSGKRLSVSIGTQRSATVDGERIHARLMATGMGPVTNRTRP
jgi:hypothetical protein